MSWDDVKQSAGGTGAGYLTLKAGEAAKIHVLDDEPHSFSSVYFNAIKKSAVVDPEDNSVKGVKGFDVRARHAINVFDYTDSKVKVLAGSNAMFDQLKGIHSEWDGLAGVDLKITRVGSGLETKYQIVPTPKCSWDETLMAGQELNDLPTVFTLTPLEVVQSYMEGVDPGTDFDTAKIEGAAEEETPEDDFTLGENAEELPEAADEEPAPTPARRPVPAAKPVVKAPAPAAKPLGRNELIMKLNHLAKAKERYKKKGAWLADVQKFGGKDKQSMSQLGADALAKLLKHVQTVK